MTSETRDQIRARDEKKSNWKKIAKTVALGAVITGANLVAANMLLETQAKQNQLERDNANLRLKVTQVETLQDADLYFACMNLRAFRGETTTEEDDTVCRDIVENRRDWLFKK